MCEHLIVCVRESAQVGEHYVREGAWCVRKYICRLQCFCFSESALHRVLRESAVLPRVGEQGCAVLGLVSVLSESATPWTVARQAPLSMGILQARILGRVAMPSSRGSSRPRDQTQVPCTAGAFFTI